MTAACSGADADLCFQREMEANLIPELQLIAQLEKEIAREKALLEQEEQQLNNLTKNASREESSRKAQMKKVLTVYLLSI